MATRKIFAVVVNDSRHPGTPPTAQVFYDYKLYLQCVARNAGNKQGLLVEEFTQTTIEISKDPNQPGLFE